MPTRIDAEIGLSAEKFRRGLDAAEKGVSQFVNRGEKQFDRLGLSIDDLQQSNRELRALIGKSYDVGAISRYNRALQENEAELKRIAKAAGQATNELNDVGHRARGSFGSANNAALSFSQVIQDMPYGIRGVANNITQLTTNLGYMAAEAKKAGVSMKAAFIASITNPATLAVLAVSAITTGMQLFANSSKKAAEEVENLGNTLDKSRASVAAEVAELKTLVSIARDAGQGRKAQQEAINRLNKEYDIFNGTLNLNNIGSEENTRLINLQTEAMVRQAQIKGVLDKITELTTKQLEIENSGIKENLKWYQFLWSSIRTGGNLLTAVEGLSEKAIQNRNKALEEGQQQIEDYKSSLRELLSIDLNFGGGGSGAAEAVRQSITAVQSELSRIGQLPNISSNIQLSIVNGVKGSMGMVYDQGVGLANAFNSGFAEILEYGIEDGISSMASAIGEALVHGGNIVQAGGGALLGALGGILVEVGKMTIGLGVTILAAKKALQTLNPFIAIGAGAALVAAGSAFAAQARDISQTIGGNTAGSSGPSGNGGSISISPANTGGIQGTVVFEISGRSLVGVLKREAIHGNRITP